MNRLYLVAWVGSLAAGCWIWKSLGHMTLGFEVIFIGLVAGILLMLICGHEG